MQCGPPCSVDSRLGQWWLGWFSIADGGSPSPSVRRPRRCPAVIGAATVTQKGLRLAARRRIAREAIAEPELHTCPLIFGKVWRDLTYQSREDVPILRK